jgi:hypothetical protein
MLYNAEGSDVDFEKRGVAQHGNIFLNSRLFTRSRNFNQDFESRNHCLPTA